MDIWAVSTFLLLWIMLLWTLVCRYLFGSLLSMLLGIYPDTELLDYMTILCLPFWGTAYCFPQHLHCFTFPPAKQRGPSFSTSSPTLVIVCLLGNWHSQKVKFEVLPFCEFSTSSYFCFSSHMVLLDCDANRFMCTPGKHCWQGSGAVKLWTCLPGPTHPSRAWKRQWRCLQKHSSTSNH